MSTLAADRGRYERAEALLTAEGLLRRRARQKPQALAIADPPHRDNFTGGEPRSLTYGEADAAVDALADCFIELGLEPGDKIAIQLPNIVEQALTLLAAWRAGLTVLMLPMLWRRSEIARACAEHHPKALVGVGTFAGETVSETLCDVAVNELSVRFVLGFGQGLADGVTALDAILHARPIGAARPARHNDGPALITFTARSGASLLSVYRSEDELLAQGAMTVMALSLTASDVILNAYPIAGSVGLSLALMPWLISGAALIQHQPFDYDMFVRQLSADEATVTALPSPILAELAKHGVLQRLDCKLQRVACVWSMPELAGDAPPIDLFPMPTFDAYPLGDLACMVRPRRRGLDPKFLPHGTISLGEGNGTLFLETGLDAGFAARPRQLLLRGPIIPHGDDGGPLACGPQGFIATGLRAVPMGEGGAMLGIKADPELLQHGGCTIPASELDDLYRSFPDYLDAACFALPDPIVGDRIFAAVVPKPDRPASLDALHAHLGTLGVALYKYPDQLLVVKAIPRDGSRVLREEILSEV